MVERVSRFTQSAWGGGGGGEEGGAVAGVLPFKFA